MGRLYDGKYDVKIVKRENENGPTLCVSESSGKGFIEQEGFVFKDLAGDGCLYPYEDWRLPAGERAGDLANRLSVEQILGLMLHTPQQMLPGYSNPYLGMATYDGKNFQETDGNVPVYAMTDQQKEYVGKDFIRHFLHSVTPDAHSTAMWMNQMQATAERAPFGVPVNVSSDPRHGCVATDEFNSGAGGKISHWPENIGMAATFDVELEQKYAEIVAKEYRAMGFTTALSPQIDIATEPRWGRFSGSYGEDSRLAADMARAYCDGLQTTEGSEDGWGSESVIAMAKHWPGAGAVESGREAHFPCGKYAVYPGNSFEDHMRPFVEGAFDLKEGTRQAAAIMPSYIIATNQDAENGENVGIAYNKYLITTLLREKYGYDELVCTDWGLTGKMGPMDIMIGAKSWGVENLSPAEQSLKIIEAGCDQFGGENDIAQLKEAYALGVKRYGEEYMEKRVRTSAARILRNMFRLGLFENPYTDAVHANDLVGTAEYCEAGFKAQVKSIVMLKNRKGKNEKAALPLAEKTKVYVPKQYSPAAMNWMHQMDPEVNEVPVAKEVLEKYVTVVDTPQEADAAIVFMRMPKNARMGMDSGYSSADKEAGGNGYVPITRQYRPYTAEFAREESLAGGDPREDFVNRRYKGKTVTSYQEADLDALLDTKKAMGEKPVIACISSDGPMVVSEFEQEADGILMGFGVTYEAFLQLICGKAEPYGLLPFQMPSSMKTIEEQCEDKPFDVECHVDDEGNVYDFAFGMNWEGVIKDERVEKYKRG